jgi:hypothetical protein
VNAKVRRQLKNRKKRIARRLERIDRQASERPELAASNIHYEIADRTRAIATGGIGAAHLLINRLDLERAIKDRLGLLKVHLPYHESDHVLNIAYNLLAGGTRLEHLELLRNDEGYLDALGARRIPDPITAGDFCRRFDVERIGALQEVFNDTRVEIWKQRSEDFFREAILDADGTMVETTGQCKEGMNINYKNQWGYHPLVLSLANTGEPLYVVNRPGNRLSHEQAAAPFDKAIGLCHRAGFRRIRLRGDTAFSQTEHLDGWAANGVTFVFGIQAMPNLYDHAENLPRNAWQELVRPPKHRTKTAPRQRPENVKQQVVEERKFRVIRLAKEYVADFRCRPIKCEREYRIVVLWKDLEVHQGQRKLFDDNRCFFFITNDFRKSAAEIVPEANHRCNQGESLRPPQERHARPIGSRGHAVEQLGVHGNGLAGLESEGMDGPLAADRGAGCRRSWRRETNNPADGVHDVPSCLHGDLNANREDGQTDCLQDPGVEPLAAHVLPPARSTEHAAPVLAAGLRSRSPDAPVPIHA